MLIIVLRISEKNLIKDLFWYVGTSWKVITDSSLECQGHTRLLRRQNYRETKPADSQFSGNNFEFIEHRNLEREKCVKFENLKIMLYWRAFSPVLLNFQLPIWFSWFSSLPQDIIYLSTPRLFLFKNWSKKVGAKKLEHPLLPLLHRRPLVHHILHHPPPTQ